MLFYYLVLIAWCLLGSISSRIAKKRGLHPMTWFFVGFFFGIFGIAAALLWKAPEQESTPETPDPLLLSLRRKHWYYLDHDKNQLGPVSFDNLKRAFRDERVTGSSYVWHEELEDWQRIEETEGLKDYFNPTTR
ncbi:MAG: DUF4339 domain-containing protein [Simkaniaceae bacterium]|nr:DUF4339 domain-containing protein [Simkaniaceae bacterium]